MKKCFFISFWLFVALGTATVVFNSCGKDDPKKEEPNPNNPDNPNDPNNPTTIAVTGISLDVPTLTLLVNEEQTLMATVMPDNATDQTVTWTSSDKTKASVVDGKVNAVAVGTTTITAQAGDQTVTCIVTVKINPLYDEGVIINGVKWATRNVAAPGTFADNPENAGMFYQWNSNVGWSATPPIINSNGGGLWAYNWNGGGASFWEESSNPCPAGWRIPTYADLLKLTEVNSNWTTVNGMGGWILFGSGNNTLFLPAVGYIDENGMLSNNVGTYGDYWSNGSFSTTSAYHMYFGNEFSSLAPPFHINKVQGHSCRCVAE